MRPCSPSPASIRKRSAWLGSLKHICYCGGRYQIRNRLPAMAASENTPLIGASADSAAPAANVASVNWRERPTNNRAHPPHTRRAGAADRDIGRERERGGAGSETGGGATRLHKVLREMVGLEGRSSSRFFRTAVFCIANHIIGGALAMRFLEGWPLADALYFCIVTMTTVGYGDMTPTRAVSKVYVMYYVVVSIGLITTLLSYLLSAILERQEDALLGALTGEGRDELDEYDSDGENGSGDAAINARIMHATRGLDVSDYYGLFHSAAMLVVVIASGVVVFAQLEKLSLLDAMYATVISATTVGFGDYEPTRKVTKLIMIGWLGVSTICVAKVVTDFADANIKAKQRAMSRRMLTASVDLEALHMLDTDHDGSLDRAEFLGEMLVRGGKVERADVEAILLRFAQLDGNHDGGIDAKECVR